MTPTKNEVTTQEEQLSCMCIALSKQPPEQTSHLPITPHNPDN